MYSGDFTVESNWKIRRVEMTRKGNERRKRNKNDQSYFASWS